MTDPLREQIGTALKGELDPQTFEDCAADLLSPIYPTLTPIRGSSDYGQDAAGDAAAEDGVLLVCTTGDRPLENLRGCLKAYEAAGLPHKRAVLATSVDLTPKRKLNLYGEAAKRGFQLSQIYDHRRFVNQLYRDNAWRLDLLGLAGTPSALSEVPVSRRQSMDVPLVGRDKLLGALRSATGDLVIYGAPGVGKTFLLEHLAAEGWGLFVVGSRGGRNR